MFGMYRIETQLIYNLLPQVHIFGLRWNCVNRNIGDCSFPFFNKYLFFESSTFSMQIESSLDTFSFKLPVVLKICVSL